MGVTAEQVKALAAECGFELAGITPAMPLSDFARFEAWRASGFAAEMAYLTDRRGDLRDDPRHLLGEARTIICVGKLYNTPEEQRGGGQQGKIASYARGAADYHLVMRQGLERLAARIAEVNNGPFSWRACVDTAPLLERSYAQAAGLGWIGKNTCLINQESGSWFFLGELLISLPLEPDGPPPFRCGSCSRCIDACPTEALVPAPDGGWSVDSDLCISYLTIEKRGPISPAKSQSMGTHLFGCDICQDVCPWNKGAPFTGEERFAMQPLDTGLVELADLTADGFRSLFRDSAVWRAKYEGFLRNVAIALGNSGGDAVTEPLRKLARHPNGVVAIAAEQALQKVREERALFNTEKSSYTYERTMQSETSKPEFYQAVCAQLQELLKGESNLIANAANTVALLFHSLPEVNWVGFYFAEGDELVLGPFQGKPACARIRFGKGVCGTVAKTGESIIVPDVNDFPGHIVCDAASRSEVVAPLWNWGKFLGVLDIDSASANRFDEEDLEGIESAIAIFLGAQPSGNLPDLTGNVVAS